MESKQAIRKSILQQRAMLTSQDWKKKSDFIAEKVLSHSYYQCAKEIYCYIDYKNEVSTKKILQAAWKQGKKVAVPRIDNNEMHFYYIDSLTELQEGFKGILEPTGNTLAHGNEILIIMPGVAFDKKKHRIGYGKGFYDRYLADLSCSFQTIALAFELQVLDGIPVDIHDQIPNLLITEENIYV